MPPRLTHRKSRRGCERCKSRKVKCDERKPKCGACQRHSVECNYGDIRELTERTHIRARSAGPAHSDRPESAPDTLRSANTTPSHLWNNSTSATGYQSQQDNDELELQPDVRRVLELKLLHYFTYVVAPTAISSERPDTSGAWSAEAVCVAFEHPCLLNAFLAMAALHAAVVQQQSLPGYDFASTSLSERVYAGFHSSGTFHNRYHPNGLLFEKSEEYHAIFRAYLNRALREQRQALSSLSSDNVDAVVLTSLLLAQLLILNNTETSLETKAYCPPTQWLYVAQSISVVYNVAEEYLSSGDLAVRIGNTPDPNLRDYTVKMDATFLIPFQPILDFSPPDDIDRSDIDAMEAFRITLTYVGGVCKAVAQGETTQQVCRRVIAFGPSVPRKWVDMVEERRPRALVILSYFIANVKYIDSYWWCKGVAERDVHGVKSILPAEWQWAMEWPLRRLQELTERKSITP